MTSLVNTIAVVVVTSGLVYIAMIILFYIWLFPVDKLVLSQAVLGMTAVYIAVVVVGYTIIEIKVSSETRS